MSDHGDDVAEFLLNRAFNQYTARETVRFILDASKRRHRAKDLGLKSENLGNHTLDFNSDYESLKEIEGFEVEKLSSNEFASLKAHIIKAQYNIDVVQVKDCLLMRTKDYAKISQPNVRSDIEKTLLEVSKDKDLVKDICTKARIEEQSIERELFSKLPYGKNGSTKERITKRSVNVSKAKNKSVKANVFNRQLAQNIAK